MVYKNYTRVDKKNVPLESRVILKSDLHLHTYFSDGGDSPENIINQASLKNIKLIAFTDHNFILSEGKHFKNNKGIRIIPGVEISTEYMSQEIHVLAYGFDEKLEEFTCKVKLSIENEYLRIVKKISKEHININVENYNNFNFDKSKGGWKLLQFLYNQGVIKKPDDYNKLIKPEININHLPKLSEVINKINRSNGIAILAHPTSYCFEINDKLVKNLKKEGIMGLECFHPTIDINTSNKLADLAIKNDLLVSGGSDYHKEFDNREIGVPSFEIEQKKGLEWVYEYL